MVPKAAHQAGGGYRADIDGLRALAVVPVVLYHAGIPGFSGGYVGVDIFFVISGFLITGIIAREIDERRFSVWQFYERRARRILPALLVMLASVLVAASVLFLPGDFEGVPRSALAALGFAANIWFFTQSGYFQGAAETMPLLHTWSLGVEEQFYIVFPLALILIARFATRRCRLLVWLGALASFALAVATQDAGDGSAFYLLPARAWELLAGSLLALGAVPRATGRAMREALSWTGLALIVAPVLTYDRTTVFPGLAALPPVLGAALLIHAGPATQAGKMLSLRPLVWVGLISYSLYLWHWPLIVFVQYWQDAPLTLAQSAGIIAASLVAAWLSLRFVETPFRSRQRYSSKAILALSVGGMAGLGAICLALVSLGGWSTRFPPDVARYAAASSDVSPVRSECLRTRYAPPDRACTLGAEVTPDTLLWGDSHGVEFAWALGERLGRQGRALEQRTLGSCAPVLDPGEQANADCRRFNEAVLAEIAARPNLRTIVLVAYWESGRIDDTRPLEATLSRLEALGRKVVLIGAVPAQPIDVPRALARASAFGAQPPLPRERSDYEARTAWLRERYDSWRLRGVRVIDPAESLFAGREARLVSDEKVLYFDSHHLTLAGARLVLGTYGSEQGD